MPRFALDQRGMTNRVAGLAGATGSTGATGSGAVFTAVDSLNVAPRSVADWGTILNAAIAGGVLNQHFVFGAYDYPFSTPINFGASFGVTFEGSGAGAYTTGLGGPQTRLIYTGGGSGTAINLGLFPSGATFSTFRDLIITYSSASFTGALMNAGQFVTVLQHCVLGDGSRPRTADCMLNLSNANTFICRDCDILDQCANTAVRGKTNPAGDFSNIVHFEACTFHNVAVIDPGLDYVFDHVDFELQNLASGAACITNSGALNQIPSVTLRDCDYWDGVPFTNNAIVRFSNAISAELNIYSCNDHNATNAFTSIYDLKNGGTSKILIVGGTINSSVNVGNAGATPNQRKNTVVISGVSFPSGITAAIANLDTGHDNVETSGNYQAEPFDGTRTIGYERITNLGAGFTQFAPTITYPYGGTLATLNRGGNDIGGYIQIKNNAGAPSPTGKIADVTCFRTFRGLNGATSFPCVVIGPYGFIDSYWTCQPTIVGGPNAQSWTVNVNNAIPAGGTMAFAYRMIYL